ncbi:Uncharacterised protein [uncultured archaeon]|nr:Uncharacterised protein [uncultured archaeon]
MLRGVLSARRTVGKYVLSFEHEGICVHLRFVIFSIDANSLLVCHYRLFAIFAMNIVLGLHWLLRSAATIQNRSPKNAANAEFSIVAMEAVGGYGSIVLRL